MMIALPLRGYVFLIIRGTRLLRVCVRVRVCVRALVWRVPISLFLSLSLSLSLARSDRTHTRRGVHSTLSTRPIVHNW